MSIEDRLDIDDLRDIAEMLDDMRCPESADELRQAADEIARLRAEVEDKREAPTKWAYDQACNALHKAKARIAELEAESARLRAENRYLNNTGAGLLRS